jgi:hypothetical protein
MNFRLVIYLFLVLASYSGTRFVTQSPLFSNLGFLNLGARWIPPQAVAVPAPGVLSR